MKRRSLISLVLVVVLTTVLRAAELSVFAAASLTDALKEVAAAYESQSGDKLLFNFAGSNALARQIKEGAPADIFFSADEIQMNNLAEARLIDPSTRVELLSNSLVIVVPNDGPAELTPAALGDRAIKRVALADPQSVPAGVYAREYSRSRDFGRRSSRRLCRRRMSGPLWPRSSRAMSMPASFTRRTRPFPRR